MRIYEFFLTLVLGFVLVLAVMNKSVFSYIEQKYHTALFDPSSPVLHALAAPARALDSARAWLFPSKEELALSTLESSAETEPKELEQEEIEPQEQVIYPLITQDGRIVLELESTFLFIGDSLMQGVGMTLGRELKKRGFSVIDIAKQSTGLTYVEFFDWGKTLKDAFAKNPHIKVVVIMVGANDPYNMPKIKYASPEWVEIYQGRVREILETANEHNAIVAWYEAPIVKKPSLNTKLAFLNTLYATEVASHKAVLLPSNTALAPEGIYTAYGKTQAGKSVKLRANDGIHFSGDGSRALGALLLERLEVLEEEMLEEGKKGEESGENGEGGEDAAQSEQDRALDTQVADFTALEAPDKSENQAEPNQVELDSSKSAQKLDSSFDPSSQESEESKAKQGVAEASLAIHTNKAPHSDA